MMQPDMWSGWGIRTLSASHKSFNPYNYQTGAVWPRDNAIIALGFRRYGFAAEAGGRKFTLQVAEIATTWAGQYRLGALSRTPRDCSQRQKSRHRLWPSAARYLTRASSHTDGPFYQGWYQPHRCAGSLRS